MSVELLRAFLDCLSTDRAFTDHSRSIPADTDCFNAVKESGYDFSRATAQTLPHPERHWMNHVPRPQDKLIAGPPSAFQAGVSAAA